MGRTKRVFSKEFKEEAVKLVQAGTRSATEVAASLKISPSLLSKWIYKTDALLPWIPIPFRV